MEYPNKEHNDYVIDNSVINTSEATSLQSVLLEKMLDLPQKISWNKKQEEENRDKRNEMIEAWTKKYAKIVRDIISDPLNEEIRVYLKEEKFDEAATLVQKILENIPVYN